MAQLLCARCKSAYPPEERRWRCDCGAVLDLDFTPAFNLPQIARRKPNLWRYREALPIAEEGSIVTFEEGFTPLTEVVLQGKAVLVKQDHIFPTGSFKDRGASVLVSKMRELGIREAVEDSSGNAGAAIAAYCARAGIGCHIFVPAHTSQGKLAQIQLYGARLNRVPGSREDTTGAALKAAEGSYYASHSWNPFFLHGTKTFAFEVCEQLGWRCPDTVVLPVGNGTLLLGAHIGFREMRRAGVTDRIPAIIAVQAESCASLYRAFREQPAQSPGEAAPETLAEGIAVAAPVRGGQVLEAVRHSGGRFIAVTENEIRDSLLEMCRRGYYIEPTSAAAIAGLERYLPESRPDEIIVSVFTGHGLKATEKMFKIPGD